MIIVVDKWLSLVPKKVNLALFNFINFVLLLLVELTSIFKENTKQVFCLRYWLFQDLWIYKIYSKGKNGTGPWLSDTKPSN